MKSEPVGELGVVHIFPELKRRKEIFEIALPQDSKIHLPLPISLPIAPTQLSYLA